MIVCCDGLADLGGPAAGRLLILLDLRGTGDSAPPADESAYRVDRQGARLAALFPRGSVDVQPRAGHFPWPDDAAWFAARVERFLAAGVWGRGPDGVMRRGLVGRWFIKIGGMAD
ncbi:MULTISPECIES: alpha/beta fold hydrolase [Streptomyces]|uniref:alpha/beta fold hydrolase n=1 Tax=Streptomyces TaxID=1883 RepID=UPI002B1D36A5|nr:hypothetical protein [Streptomyces sp. NBC_00160]